MKAPQVVIVGGGPAGMVLAYQLVSNGVPVRVLERHPDFEREFRGELLQDSVVEALDRAGLFPELLRRKLALPDIERRMFLGKHRTFGKGLVVVFQPSTGHRLHLAYSEPGDLNTLRKDLPELRRRLLPTLPEALRPHVERQLDERTEWQVLKILVDRVRRWHAPGVLFLGDAAHTMSPSGGQGLNLAIRDTFVAANHLLDALQAGRPLDDALFQRIQDERQPEIDRIQAGQTRAGQMVLKPLGVLHVMFSILAVVMKLAGKKLESTGGVPTAAPRYLTPHTRHDSTARSAG